MLKCPNCHAEISTLTEVCPLCHTRLGNEDVSGKSDIVELAYPPIGKLSHFSRGIFGKIYLGIWLIAFIGAIIAELLVTGNLRYVWAPAAFTLYLYILLRAIVRGGIMSFTSKVSVHIVFLSAALCSLIPALPSPAVLPQFILPILYAIALVTVCIYTIAHHKRPEQYLLSIIFIGLLCAIPFVTVMAIGTPSLPVAAITALAMGGTAIIGVMVFKPREIIAELKRKFHL